jgi:hypothetical protein
MRLAGLSSGTGFQAGSDAEWLRAALAAGGSGEHPEFANFAFWARASAPRVLQDSYWDLNSIRLPTGAVADLRVRIRLGLYRRSVVALHACRGAIRCAATHHRYH